MMWKGRSKERHNALVKSSTDDDDDDDEDQTPPRSKLCVFDYIAGPFFTSPMFII